MSDIAHRDLTDCPPHNGDAKWVGACACGWTCDPRASSDYGTFGASRMAHEDYRQHVENVLGVAQAYYQAPVRCMNCGSEHEQGVLIGTRVRESVCIRCGVTNLLPDNEAYRDDEERIKGLRWPL